MEAEYAIALESPARPSTWRSSRIMTGGAREEALCKLGATPEQLKWYRQKVDAKGGLAKTDPAFASDPDVCFIVSGSQFFDKARTEALLAAAQAFKPLNELRVVRPGGGRHASSSSTSPSPAGPTW